MNVDSSYISVLEDTKVETTSATIEPKLPIVNSDTVATTAVPADTSTTVTSSDEVLRIKRGFVVDCNLRSICGLGK